MLLLKENANFDPTSYRSNNARAALYENTILVAPKGFIGLFHEHGTALLSEFYGKKMVLLLPPHTNRELVGKFNETVDGIVRAIYKRYKDHDVLFDADSGNDNYFPFQQVILEPGDLLYIPSGWYHSVYYLTPCIGATQFILFDKMNRKTL